MPMIYDAAGNVVSSPNTELIYNDLTVAPFYNALPADTMAVPIVMKAMNGNPRLALLHPGVLANTVTLFKFPGVVLAKTGLTLSAGPNSFTVPVPGLLAGDTLIVTPTVLPTGYGVFQCACLAKDVLTVPVQCPGLISGAFSITMNVIAIRNTAVLV